MKKTNWSKNIYYIVSFTYVFLGSLFLDWSFTMTPPLKSATVSEIQTKLVVHSFYIVVGIILYISTFLTVRGKVLGKILFRFLLFGIIASVFGAIIPGVANKLEFMPVFDVGFDGTLIFPVIILALLFPKLLGANKK